MLDAPLKQYRDTVSPEFIDYNGHMNVGYYVVLFDRATDVLLDALDIGADYARRTNRSTFVLEAHITYQQELVGNDTLMVETQLLDYDAKRIHYFHRMYHSEQGYVAATLEQLSLHVDLEARRSCEFAPDVHARITAAANVHAKLSRPKEACSTIGIRHRR